jgi:polyhydroxyalkanoate synthesis regulator phasin
VISACAKSLPDATKQVYASFVSGEDMPEAKEQDTKPFDPFEPFRGMRDAYLDAMSKTMIDAVNTESYAQTTGAMLDSYLTASAPFREALEKSMLQVLQQFSLPSRQEVAALAERFTNVEMRLDDLDAKLDRILNLIDALKQAQEAVGEAERKRPPAKRR